MGSCEQPLPSDSDEPTDTAGDELMTNAGIERAIPLTFYKLYAASDPDLWLRIRQSVVVANMMFKAAGIQFHIARVRNCATNGEFADVRSPLDDDLIQYQSAFPALDCAFGNLPPPPQLPPAGGSQGRVWWLDYATLHYGRDNEIVVWLHQYANSHWALFPWEGRGVHMIAPDMGDTHQLGHELGHTFGLPHTFDVVEGWYVGTGPGEGIIDPSTGPAGEKFKREDFWDLVYGKGLNQFLPHEYYGSRTAAASSGRTLLNIHRYNSNPIRHNCTGSPSCCRIGDSGTGGASSSDTCGSGPPGYYYQDRTYPHSALKGIAFEMGTGQGRNIMSYMPSPPGQYGFSDSQVHVMRKFLRYETAILVNYGCDQTACIGGRTRLGHYVQRQPTYHLDFDGDGRRDIAWWDPPVTGVQASTVHVLLSTMGYSSAPGQKVTITGIGEAGDIPVAADYNGDGLTDVAFYQPGSDPFGANPDQSYWRVCNNLDCSNVQSYDFGFREDVPLPGLNFDGNPTTSEIAVYRPSQALWTWKQIHPTLQPPVERQFGNQLSVPLPGLYGTDAATDLAVYLPEVAVFAVTLASSSWTQTLIPALFPNDCVANDFWGSGPSTRAGCFPVRGMKKHVFSHYVGKPPFFPVYVPRDVLSLWKPHGATWYTRWDPLTFGEPAICALGTVNEVPLGGIGTSTQNRNSVGYSTLTTSQSEAWSAAGTLKFRPGPCGTASTQTAPTMSPKTMVFPTSDMTGDYLPEIWFVNPATMQATIRISHDYATQAPFSPIQVGTNQGSIIL